MIPTLFWGLRTKLMAGAALPPVVLGALVPVLGPGWALAAGAGLALVAAAWALVVTRPLDALADHGLPFAKGLAADQLPRGGDEAGRAAEALRILDGRLRDLREQFAAALETAAATVTALRHRPDPAAVPALPGPFAEAAGRWALACADLAAFLRQTWQQNLFLGRVLQGLPAPVLAADPQGQVQFLNAAAERLFGREAAACHQKPLAALLTDPEAVPDVAQPGEGDAPPLGAQGAQAWLRQGAGAACEAVGRDARGRAFVLELLRGGDRGLAVLAGRDLTEARQLDGERRQRARAGVVRQLVRRLTREFHQPLQEVQARARVLAMEVKQLGQREKLLPRVEALVKPAVQAGVFCQALARAAELCGEPGPALNPSEFMAGEVARLAQQRLAPRFAAQNNTLQITDQGGWLLCDADTLEAALACALAHACDANRGATVELRIDRHAAASADGRDLVAFQILDAGAALPAEVRRRLDHPFGGLTAPDLDAFPSGWGFPLGLIVARHLAGRLEGALELADGPGNQLAVTLRLPTRLDRARPAKTVAASGGAVPEDETCAGWRLGVARG